MLLRKLVGASALCMLLGLMPLRASAQVAVIDFAAVINLMQQVMYWQQQITAMSNQLTQLQNTYGAMTGSRGMEALLPVTNEMRNYLPPDYAELLNTVNGATTGYAGLSSQVQSIVNANAVLTNTQMGNLSPEQRSMIEAGRRSAALLSSVTQVAYQNTSQRFAALQQLITMVGAAGDTKAIQDLQGRIQAEQAMLTNEQTKLQTLYQVAQAEKLQQEQRVHERVVQDHGRFDTRFSPTPP